MSISVETLALAKKNTKQAVEEAVTSVYRYKGSVETLNDLPTSGQKVGDVYNVVSEAGQNYAWDGSNWDALGIAENLGDIEFQGEGLIETDVSFDGNNDRVTYSEFVDCSKAIPLENLASNEIIIEHEGHNNPYYLGYAFSNSTNNISFFSGPGIPVQNTNNQSVYTIENYESYKETYKYFFLPLTTEKRGPQGQSTGEKEEYFINPIITYKILEQGMVTKTINQNFDDSNKVDKKVQIAKDAAQTANNRANDAYSYATSAYNRARSAYNQANYACNAANFAANNANNAYNAANVANNSLNNLGNVEFPTSSGTTTTVTKDLTNDKTTSWGVPIRAREVKDGKITIKVTNNQDMPTVQHPNVFDGGYGPTPQEAIMGPGGYYTPELVSSNVDEYIYTINKYAIQNDYYIFINNELKNMSQSTGFFFQGTLSYETEVVETHTINEDYYDKTDVDNLVGNATNDLGNIEFNSEGLNFTKTRIDSTDSSSYQQHYIKTLDSVITTPGLTYNEIMYTLDNIGYIIEDTDNNILVDSFEGCIATGYNENTTAGGYPNISFQRIENTNKFSGDVSQVKTAINSKRETEHYKYFFLCLFYANGNKQYRINEGTINYYKASEGTTTKTINNYYIDKYQINKEIENYVDPVYRNANNAYNSAYNAYRNANNAYNVANNAYNRANTASNQTNAAYNRANTAYNTANTAYNAANIANNSLNNLGNVEFAGEGGGIQWIEHDLGTFNINSNTTKGILTYPEGIVKEIQLDFGNNNNIHDHYRNKLYIDVPAYKGTSETDAQFAYDLTLTRDSVNQTYFNVPVIVYDENYPYSAFGLSTSDQGSYRVNNVFTTSLSNLKLRYRTEDAHFKTINNDYYDKDATNSLANDTLNAAKAYTDSKFDISLKKEVVQELPAEGEEDILYLVPKADAETEDIYDEYIWTNNDWEKIGSTATDLNNYYNKTQIDNMRQADVQAINYAANTANNAYNTANAATNLAQAAYDAANSLAPAAWQEISNVTTNEATNSVTLPIDKEYDEYLITFNRPIVMDGPNPADSMTSNDGSLLLSIGGQTVIGSKLSIYNKMDGIYTVKRIIDNMYYGTGYHNGLMSNLKDYTENIVDINDASNGGVVLSTSASGSTANIASNITITLYGKGGTPQQENIEAK